MKWLRLYTEIKHDRKLRRLPPAQRWLWIVILTIARESPIPGFLLLSKGVTVTVEDLCDEAAIPIEEVKAGIASFINQKMLQEIDGTFSVINWDKRQFASDSSKERTKNYRNRKETTSQERHKNVTVAPPETDTETDTDINNNAPALFCEITEQEKQTLNTFQGVKGYPFNYETDLALIRTLAVEFPKINVSGESVKWATWLLDHPLTKKSNPRLRFRNWCDNAQQWSGQPARAASLKGKDQSALIDSIIEGMGDDSG